jgi:hypothetical protein
VTASDNISLARRFFEEAWEVWDTLGFLQQLGVVPK